MITYDFIENIGKINIKYSKKYRKKYLAFIDEFSTEEEYRKKLDEYLYGFKREIYSLPFKLTTKQSRKTFSNNLLDEFLLNKELLNAQFKQAITQSYDCITHQRSNFKFYFPRYFQKKYLIKARDSYKKMRVAYSLQIDKIENALDILKSSAINDGIELKVFDNDSKERVGTTLSSPELAYLSFVILQKVAEDKNFNRSQLSRLLANNFATKKTLSPQPSQLRKHFTEVNDNVKTKVEKLFLDLSKPQ